ncbi:MAG: hypothetical protein AB1480_15045 [Nitrospirota bacterium]
MPQAQKDLDGFSGKLLSRFEEIILGLYDEPRPTIQKNLVVGAQDGVSELETIEYFMKLMIHRKL